MVNNAGVGGTEHHGMVHEMTEETWDHVMNVNSRSVFLGCKYACAQFLNQEPHSSGHRGWIINTSSIMGLVGQAVYGGELGCGTGCRDDTEVNASCLLLLERIGHTYDEANSCRVR